MLGRLLEIRAEVKNAPRPLVSFAYGCEPRLESTRSISQFGSQLHIQRQCLLTHTLRPELSQAHVPNQDPGAVSPELPRDWPGRGIGSRGDTA